MPDSAADNHRSAAHLATGVRIRTGARLHFGLLDTSAPFGGIGVMIDDPVTEITVTPSDRFEPGPIETERIAAIARRLAARLGESRPPDCRVEVTRRPPQHAGLGSGTQLSLAVAEALCQFVELEVPKDELARDLAGRGQRSGVGLNGYFHGGLIAESAEDRPDVAVPFRRIELPPAWTVVVLRPQRPEASISGALETQQFDRLPGVSPATVARLRDQVAQRIVPAAAEGDFDAFADAVTRYNAASGELFRAVQGGTYNGPAVTSLINWLRQQGVAGSGQSSWGPGVFAWFNHPADARRLTETLPSEFELLTVTSTRNRGREIARLEQAKSP